MVTLKEIQNELSRLGDKKRADGEKKYLKSPLAHYGVKVPLLRQISKNICRNNNFATCRKLSQALWGGESHEERMIAIFLLVYCVQELTWEDYPFVKHMVKTATGWAQLDMIAAWLCGELYTKYPAKMTRELKKWNQDTNFWVRRASILTLLGPVRENTPTVFPLFIELSVPLLSEKEFFIRKAVGWVLRELSKSSPQQVIDYVDKYGAQMSGLTKREATRKLIPCE